MESFEQPHNTSEGKKMNNDELVQKLASLAHDAWREPRKIEGTDIYEPRVKETKDANWIGAHGGKTEVDIANTPYSELPEDWQKENRESAQIAMDEVWDADMYELPFNERFVEKASEVVHAAWVERNKNWASEELKKPYAKLSEEEKEKDRFFVHGAIEVFTKYVTREA
ncbi:MAG: hypothetical protein Q8O83_03235 [bacterium]|nr:hypothetical protein [bacterium]